MIGYTWADVVNMETRFYEEHGTTPNGFFEKYGSSCRSLVRFFRPQPWQTVSLNVSFVRRRWWHRFLPWREMYRVEMPLVDLLGVLSARKSEGGESGE